MPAPLAYVAALKRHHGERFTLALAAAAGAIVGSGVIVWLARLGH